MTAYDLRISDWSSDGCSSDLARYEKVREGGVVGSQAVLIAIGIDWDGRRQILAVEMANRESATSWKDFLLRLRHRGLHGTEFVVTDDHAGLRAAIREVMTGGAYQRCYVHFLRNALDSLPRKADDQIGMASFRDRVCQLVLQHVVAGSLKKKTNLIK